MSHGQRLFPTELSKEDAEAGFVLAEVTNPETYVGEPPTIHVVMFPVDDHHRIVKIEMLGRFMYLLQRYGAFIIFGRKQDTSWSPTDFAVDDPFLAVKAAPQFMAGIGKFELAVPPARDLGRI